MLSILKHLRFEKFAFRYVFLNCFFVLSGHELLLFEHFLFRFTDFVYISVYIYNIFLSLFCFVTTYIQNSDWTAIKKQIFLLIVMHKLLCCKSKKIT